MRRVARRIAEIFRSIFRPLVCQGVQRAPENSKRVLPCRISQDSASRNSRTPRTPLTSSGFEGCTRVRSLAYHSDPEAYQHLLAVDRDDLTMSRDEGFRTNASEMLAARRSRINHTGF